MAGRAARAANVGRNGKQWDSGDGLDNTVFGRGAARLGEWEDVKQSGRLPVMGDGGTSRKRGGIRVGDNTAG
jgi:hypothetical protein